MQGKHSYSSTGAKRRRVVNTTPRPLYPRERTPVPVEQEAGWAPKLVCRREKSLNPAGIEIQIVQPVAQSLFPAPKLYTYLLYN